MTADRPRETGHPELDASAAIRWAFREHPGAVCVTASFGDPTLAHLVHTTEPDCEITLLDTGYLFAETEWFADAMRDRFGLTLRILRPDADLDRDVWQSDTDACCARRKVEPLQRALDGNEVWITGLRRADSAARGSTPIIHDDLLRSVVKVNPLAGWSDADVAAYGAEHDLPDHPLADRGYASIGCWPCTRPVTDGADQRAGRWAGSDKTECGLHL